MLDLLKYLARKTIHSAIDEWLKPSHKSSQRGASQTNEQTTSPRYITHTASKVHHNDVVYIKGEWRWITKVVYNGGPRVYMETQCGHKFSRAWDAMVRVRC